MKEAFEIEKRKIPVNVSLYGKTGITVCRFIVDTGAGHTIFDEDYISTIGYTKESIIKKELFKGFGGKIIEVPIIKIKSISCLGLIRNNFKIGFCKFAPDAFYKGILGVDFLINHKLSIDFKKGIIELE
jgi:predicted aspartyl protease